MRDALLMGLLVAFGMACTGLDGADGEPGSDGGQGEVGEPGEPGTHGDLGETGPEGTQGSQGDPGAQGDPGNAGVDGLSCWDLNGDGLQDPAEDVAAPFGVWDAQDCAGPQGTVLTSFTARSNSSTYLSPDETEPVKFDNEDHDLGDNYDPTTGSFTAPASGLYSITCHLQFGAAHDDLYLLVYRNAEAIMISRHRSIDEILSVAANATGVWALNASDVVYCAARSNGYSEVQGSPTLGFSYFSVQRIK